MKRIGEVNLFRAFRSLNYTLYFIGRSVSQFGTWMQRTAVIWVVYSMTQSTLWVGVTLFAEQIPSFLLSAAGGVAADRHDRYKIIKITQIASIIQSVLLAFLVYINHAPIWAILALSALLGVINAYDVPARQALVYAVVADPSDLPNALSLTTAMASMAQLLGPALSGIVLSVFGAPVCFMLNAASFGGVLLSLFLMKLPPPQIKKSDKKVITEFREGFEYLVKTPSIGLLILMLGIVSLLVFPYSTVIPAFAKEIFKGNASTFGYINSFIGVGSVLGTVFLASRKPGTHLKQILFVSTLVMGVGMIGFSLTKSFPIAMCFAVLVGYGGSVPFTVSNIVAQSESAPHMRGRVIGILLMAIFGMLPIGSLLIGAISEHLGAAYTMLAEGILCLIVPLAFIKFLNHKGTYPAPDTVDAETIETEEKAISS